MGISHWVESDNAADFRGNLVAELNYDGKGKIPVKTRVRNLVSTELKTSDNEWNTPGFLNLALVLETEDEKSQSEYCEDLPKFSHMLTIPQLRSCAKQLRECKWPEERPRLVALARMVDKIIRKR